MDLFLRMGQIHKGQAWIYICSVLLLLYTEIYRSMQRLLENLRQSFLISLSYKNICTYFSSVHLLLTGTVAFFILLTVLFTCLSSSSTSNCSFCLKCFRAAFKMQIILQRKVNCKKTAMIKKNGKFWGKPQLT